MSQRSVLNHSKSKRFLLLPAVILSVVVICLMLLYVFLRENPIMRIPNLQPAGRLSDGYEWQLENGPDFYIYRAQRPGNDSSGVGCVIQAIPTIDSDGCRPPVPGRADHQFRRHGVHFFRDIGIGGRHRLDSVGGMLRNPDVHN